MAQNTIFKAVPTVALRGIVLFPGVNFHFDVGRSKSIEAIDRVEGIDQRIFLVTQKEISVEAPKKEDLFNIGVIAEVKQVLKMPRSDIYRVIVEVKQRAKILSFEKDEPYFCCNIETVSAKEIEEKDHLEAEAVMRMTKVLFDEFAHKIEDAAMSQINLISDPDELANVVASAVTFDASRRQDLLEDLDPLSRLKKLCVIMNEEAEITSIETELENEIEYQTEKNQREFYLRERLRIISKELEEFDDTVSSVSKYKDKINALKCSDEIRSKLLNECARLEKMQGGTADVAVAKNYLDVALSLPFGKYTKDNINLKKARNELDKNHYGLKNVKERFIEMLAVKKNAKDVSGQIICLVGPPGIGKTSIVRSVANSMGRSYVRMSLGGVSDEAEIRGHRKTYVASMPGRIVNALISAKSFNPVILLDEIDKLANDYRGDPAAAMLEVLDPEQNFSFRDNFLEFPIDLSKVLFITTANDASKIPAPLYDRMEIIDLTSYSPEEKFNIAKNHLVKKQLKLHGLSGNSVRFTDDGIKYIIERYTREAGVRKLEQQIASICRKCTVALFEENSKRLTINELAVKKFLGTEKFKKEIVLRESAVGIVNGLAWTSVGGEILEVEAVKMKGDGKLKLTGSLGDVMKESAETVFSFIKSKAEEYKIPFEMFKENDFHIHFPEGAVPKDGPSAGVTIAVVLLSILTGKKVDSNVAMTGEATLSGRVLAIGGLKEKSMAAYKAGIKKVIIPKDNLSDLEEIDDEVKSVVEFIAVEKLDEVFSHALIGEEKSEVILSLKKTNSGRA